MASLALGTVQLGMGYGAANTTGRSHFMRACLRANPAPLHTMFLVFFLVFEADSLCCSSLWDHPPVASRSGTTLRCVCVRDRDANRCKCISCPRNARDIPAGMWKVGTIVSTQIKVSLIIVVSEWLAEWLWHGMHRPRPPRSCTLPQRTGSRRLTRRTLTTCPRRASAMPLPSSPSPAVPTWSVFPPPLPHDLPNNAAGRRKRTAWTRTGTCVVRAPRPNPTCSQPGAWIGDGDG